MVHFALALALVLAASQIAAGYVSDRMDFGQIDFKGAKVTIVTHFDHLADFREGGAYAGRLEEAKRLFNISEIELLQVGWGDVAQTALNRYLSGDSTYDFWRVPHAGFFTLAQRGALYPVSKILPPEYFEMLPRITQVKNERLRYDGELLHFSVGVPDDYGHAPFMVVNLDIFEREGFPNPYDLYYNGEWTWETIERLGQRATRDLDGDSVIDQWGISWTDPYNMIFANGGAITRLNEDGKVVFAMGEPAAIEALRTFNEWQNVQGIMVGDYQMREFFNGQVAIAIMPFWQINPEEFNFRHAVLPLAKGPNADRHVFSPGAADAIFIPANSAYPLGMIALDNFLFPLDEYEEKRDDAIAARAWDRDAYNIIHDVLDNVDGDAAYYHNFLGAWYEGSTPYGGVISGIAEGRNPATVVAELTPQAQAMIDEVLKQ